MTTSPKEKLPLKKVVIREGDYFRPGGGGSSPKVFEPVTQAVREGLAKKLQTTARHFENAFSENSQTAAVARIALKDEALAKSHRPVSLLERADCPIVGIDHLGELLVSVRPATIPKLERALTGDTTKKGVANISTIRLIEPFSVRDDQLTSLTAAVSDGEISTLKLRLFRHGDTQVDATIASSFAAKMKSLGLGAEAVNYGEHMTVYRIRGVRAEHVEELGRFVGTQSLDSFPEYEIVRPAAQPVVRLTAAVFPAPDRDVDYPVVGLIDSGIDPNNAHLNAWVAGREHYVPVADRDYEHGSFVGGLLVHARLMNHGDTRFPLAECKIVDVVAMPRGGKITEDELLAILWEVVPKYPHVRVWNLSLAGSRPCSNHTFSDMGIALDEIQTKFGVTFVLAAGNYNKPPFRDWPVTSNLGDSDRICGPADSVRAVTVGSIAHRDSPGARVTAASPSPFSRRGPGPVYLPKPEVTHYGGNCDPSGGHAQIGVLSVDGRGNLAESIGTSFASPVIAALLAHLQHRPVGGLSNLVARTLLVHSCALGTDLRTSSTEVNYRGYGVPANVDEILGSDPWRATLIFEMDLKAGVDLQLTPFPLPDCLVSDGVMKGEMTVTLAYEPPLNSRFGSEYCRTNVDVSLGTFNADEQGERAHHRQVHPFPRRGEKSALEKGLIEQGLKWSPTKVYRRCMPRGVNADQWRLVIAATDRSGQPNTAVRVAVAVTIASLEEDAHVYNDMVRSMNQLGWSTVDIQIRGRDRFRASR
ncbi:putative serine protease [Enhygromyxa salina]|uniref:Putative serine protease n=1 Tax=Enhygromyxa salina TaxID=215803 RepID=A0A0C1Z9L0_9BACT|nr:S8 family peptidase [Enhygromyxa salina]KIG14254.1 putative serine protease [Enhygromyxa salina]